MQTTDPHISAIESRANESGVRIKDVLRRAGVAQSTWTRWTSGNFSPRLTTIRRIEAALDHAATERA
jgi:predicted transcriptional regulator